MRLIQSRFLGFHIIIGVFLYFYNETFVLLIIMLLYLNKSTFKP